MALLVALWAIGVGLGVVLPAFISKSTAALMWVGVGLPLLPLGLALLGYLLATLGYRLIVCEGGIVDCTPWSVRAVPWDEVRGVYAVLTPYYVRRVRLKRLSYRVDLLNGPSLHYDHYYAEFHRLAACLQREFARATFPQALEGLRAGKWLDFDGLQLSNWGVRCGAEQISWREVQEFTASGDEFTIRDSEGDAWAAVPFTSISNVELLKQIIRYAPQVGPGAMR